MSVAGILKGSLEGKCLCEHAVIVSVLRLACALNVGLADVMVVVDEGVANCMGVGHEASIKGDGCVNVGKHGCK